MHATLELLLCGWTATSLTINWWCHSIISVWSLLTSVIALIASRLNIRHDVAAAISEAFNYGWSSVHLTQVIIVHTGINLWRWWSIFNNLISNFRKWFNQKLININGPCPLMFIDANALNGFAYHTFYSILQLSDNQFRLKALLWIEF